ncbi:MAG: DUF2520 domain-containing protein [Ignavibacteria bacterium]|nr:DUF2520 domain-containing protein [Ignavibacteria bacterium]
METKFRKNVITVIGAGRVGISLGLRLKENKFNLRYIVEKSTSRIKILKKILRGEIFSRELSEDILRNSGVVIICVKDDDIPGIILSLNKFKVDLRRKILFHTSGSESSLIFKSLNVPIKNTGSFHPVQTFNEISPDSGNYFKNIYVAAEGGKGFLDFAENICNETDTRLIRITPSGKEMYHLICVYLSNYLLSYLKSISEIGREIGFSEKKFLDVFSPLIETSLKNIINKGFMKSLTGPVERGDITTIMKHKKCLSGLDKQYSELYKLLGLEALKIAVNKKSISEKKSKILKDILNK